MELLSETDSLTISMSEAASRLVEILKIQYSDVINFNPTQ